MIRVMVMVMIRVMITVIVMVMMGTGSHVASRSDALQQNGVPLTLVVIMVWAVDFL